MWAVAWPLQIDTFIGVGELALFVALADGWTVRSRAGAWAVTVLGLAVSVAGNVGHIAGHDLASRATAAVPPLAAAAALAVGLGVLKRVVGSHETGNGITGLTAVPAQNSARRWPIPGPDSPRGVVNPETYPANPPPYPARPGRQPRRRRIPGPCPGMASPARTYPTYPSRPPG